MIVTVSLLISSFIVCFDLWCALTPNRRKTVGKQVNRSVCFILVDDLSDSNQEDVTNNDKSEERKWEKVKDNETTDYVRNVLDDDNKSGKAHISLKVQVKII